MMVLSFIVMYDLRQTEKKGDDLLQDSAVSNPKDIEYHAEVYTVLN